MNKKNLSRYYLVMFFAVSTVWFAGCDGNDGEEEEGLTSVVTRITAEVVNGIDYADQIDSVRIMVTPENVSHRFTIGDVAYNLNGSFSIDLPAEVDNNRLDPLDNFIGGGGISVSPSGVKMVWFASLRAIRYGNHVGSFYCRTFPKLSERPLNYADGEYWYVDKDVTVKGTTSFKDGAYTVTHTAGLNLKKGWNAVYKVVSRSTTAKTEMETFTNICPAGMNWYLD